ncbi:MAG: aminotransferase class I/II-fold pyridoxal phosphate-dependent enzyme, partial [Candidatus Latescibacteria bacterium]|nr:aminotransferase class I/II-fold pyridoxal phosphate-dependent enzyme [Candidatus Latescibacterota bacterium]
MSDELAILGGEKTVTGRAPVWPRFGDDEIEAATWALNEARTKRDYISASFGGEGLEAFEADFAEFLDVNHVVSTNSGCAAIHVALMAAGVKAGDEVIVSPYTWGQTVSPILQANAIPVFADIDPDTFNLDPVSVEEKISPYTKAILVVHIFGGPARMDALMDIAERHGLKVVEDCAQADGASYKGKRVGAWGHLGAFSIGNGKNLAAGDGGMVTTNDKKL